MTSEDIQSPLTRSQVQILIHASVDGWRPTLRDQKFRSGSNYEIPAKVLSSTDLLELHRQRMIMDFGNQVDQRVRNERVRDWAKISEEIMGNPHEVRRAPKQIVVRDFSDSPHIVATAFGEAHAAYLAGELGTPCECGTLITLIEGEFCCLGCSGMYTSEALLLLWLEKYGREKHPTHSGIF